MPVGELLKRTSSIELSEWQAFYRLEAEEREEQEKQRQEKQQESQLMQQAEAQRKQATR